MPKYLALLFCLAAVGGITLNNPALAAGDCQQYATKAKTMLVTFKQNALNNQHQDTSKFQAEFEPLVESMQQNNCVSELMGVLQYVQNEQKLFAAPAGMMPPTVPED